MYMYMYLYKTSSLDLLSSGVLLLEVLLHDTDSIESHSFGEGGRTTDFGTFRTTEDAVDTAVCGEELRLVTSIKQE